MQSQKSGTKNLRKSLMILKSTLNFKQLNEILLYKVKKLAKLVTGRDPAD